MNTLSRTLLVVGVLALILLAKFTRPTGAREEAPPVPASAAAQAREIAVTVEFSRARINTAMATVHAKDGKSLSRVVLMEGKGTLEIPHEAVDILLEAAGHKPKTVAVPPGGALSVKLELEGRDSEVFQNAAPRPETEGPAFCALRFSDAASGEILRGVRVNLDGEDKGASSADGEVSLPFAVIRASKSFVATLPGYADISLNLNDAVVDELHVQPILMTRLPR